MQRGSLGSSPFLLCWPEGYLSTLPVPPLGWKWNLCFRHLVSPNLACQTLLAQPFSSSGSVWERCQVPQICSPLQCLSRTQRARRCYPDLLCPGRWLCCKVGVNEGEEMPPFPSSLQHLSCALTHSLSCIPFSQTAKPLQLPAPPSLPHQWPLQAQLSRNPKRWGTVWGAWPQIHPGGSEPV